MGLVPALQSGPMVPLAIGGLGVPELLILLVLLVGFLIGPLLLILALATRPRINNVRQPIGAGRIVLIVLGSVVTALELVVVPVIVILQLT